MVLAQYQGTDKDGYTLFVTVLPDRRSKIEKENNMKAFVRLRKCQENHKKESVRKYEFRKCLKFILEDLTVKLVEICKKEQDVNRTLRGTSCYSLPYKQRSSSEAQSPWA